MPHIHKLATCLWFDRQAEEAASLYTSLLPDSRIVRVSHYEVNPPGSDDRIGTVMTVDFVLAGQEFVGLNGGPEFPFSEAVSFMIKCEDQAEIDRLWDALIAGGGEPSQCGWLKDRFGLSWQIVPAALDELLGRGGEGAKRATEAMLKMSKLDIAALEAAYRGE